MKRICVFCGASVGRSPRFAEMARELGAELARRGVELVYGGGNIGLMGAVADGTLAAGGRVIGVIPRALLERELAHAGAQELIVTATMHERKARMAELADAFVALPGGFGTLDELCEVLTWAQLGIHSKPIALLDVEGYWKPLVALFDASVRGGFVSEANRRLLIEARGVQELFERLESAPFARGNAGLTPRDL